MTTGYVNRVKGKELLSAASATQFGKGGGIFRGGGNLYSNYSTTGIGSGNDTTEDTLDTFTLPANSLDVVGRTVQIVAWGVFGGNTHAKQARLYFGSEIQATGSVTTSSSSWFLELNVIKAATNAQVISGQVITGSTHGGVSNQTATENDAAGIVLKVTGQTSTSATADVALQGWIVQVNN